MNVAIDLGKYRSYVVMEENDSIVKEGYTETTKYGFSTFFGDVGNATIIVEACSSLGRISTFFEGHEIIAVHPMKVKMIAESVKKTDKIDAHTLLDLYKAGYLPRAYLPNMKTIEERDICRNRQFLVEKRTALKNRIRYMMFQYGVEFKNFNRKNKRKLDAHPILRLLRQELDSADKRIKEFNDMIERVAYQNHYARLIYTVPGIGRVGALTLASEIADVHRFREEGNLFSYAGLVPRIHQSGSREWRGHIIKGDTFIKRILVECVQVHIRMCPNSPITAAYNRIRERAGHKKAVIAAARRMLRIIYWMLMRDESYHPNE